MSQQMTLEQIALVSDNGSSSFPYENWYVRWPEDFAVAAEMWEKFADPAEHQKIRAFRCSVKCLKCGAVMLDSETTLRQHQGREHRGESVQFDYVNHLWTWEMFGFADHWWGQPRGWYAILDDRDPGIVQYEADALELGTQVADCFWAA